MTKQYDALGFGEVMARLSPAGGERLDTGGLLERYAAGSELNVMAGLAELGLRSAMLTKMPENALSRFVLSQARACGVLGDAVLFDRSEGARLGCYYFEKAGAPRKPYALYDRADSSIHAFRLEEARPFLSEARLFHTSGITLGLGGAPRAAAEALIPAFKEAGVLVSFDVNYRAALWEERGARDAIAPLLPLLDILFISEESLCRMFGRAGALEDILPAFAAEYQIPVILSTRRRALSSARHTFTALGYHRASGRLFTEPPYDIEVLDRIGSGDAFAAGALSALLQDGADLEGAVRRGNAMAAAKCTVPGDLPRTDLAEIEALMEVHIRGGGGELRR